MRAREEAVDPVPRGRQRSHGRLAAEVGVSAGVHRRAAGAHGYDAARAGRAAPPLTGDDWLALTGGELPVGAVYAWAVRPDCGAVVLFSGTVRDHADGREGVEHLTYEAYEEAVADRLAAIASEARERWPTIGRLAVLAPDRPGRRRRVVGARGRVGSASRRGVRRRALRHRRPEGIGPDLEARDLARGQRLGHEGHADQRCRDRRVTAVIVIVIVAVVVVAIVVALVLRARRPDTVEVFQRQIDALSPEARKPVVEQVQQLDERGDDARAGARRRDDERLTPSRRRPATSTDWRVGGRRGS